MLYLPEIQRNSRGTTWQFSYISIRRTFLHDLSYDFSLFLTSKPWLSISERSRLSAIFKRRIRWFFPRILFVFRILRCFYFTRRADFPRFSATLFLEPIRQARHSSLSQNSRGLSAILRYPFLRFKVHGCPRGFSVKKAAGFPHKNSGESWMLRNRQPCDRLINPFSSGGSFLLHLYLSKNLQFDGNQKRCQKSRKWPWRVASSLK